MIGGMNGKGGRIDRGSAVRGSRRQRKKAAIGTHKNRTDPRMEICPKCLDGVSGWGFIYEHGGNFYECPDFTTCDDCGISGYGAGEWLRHWKHVRGGRSIARGVLIHRFGWMP